MRVVDAGSQDSDPSDGFTKHAVAENVWDPSSVVGGADTVSLALHELGSTGVVPSAVLSHSHDTRVYAHPRPTYQ